MPYIELPNLVHTAFMELVTFFSEVYLYIRYPAPQGFFLPEAESFLEQPFEMRRLQTIHEVSAYPGQNQYFQVL